MLEALPPARGVCVRADDKRGYATPLGKLASVTTILGATSEGKERLEQWLKRPDAEAIGAAARARGTWLHQCAEDWLEAHNANQPLPDPKHFAFGAYWRCLKPWLEQHWLQLVAKEEMVYHPAGFAGSFDVLGYCRYGKEPEKLTLLDWKTSKSKRSADLVLDYSHQLSAYTRAIDYVYGVRPERALLVIARPNTATPDVWEYDADELEINYQAFRRRVSAYYKMPQDP